MRSANDNKARGSRTIPPEQAYDHTSNQLLDDDSMDEEVNGVGRAGSDIQDFTEVHDDNGHDAVGNKAHELEERKTLARKESQAVSYARIAVYLVVLAVTVLVSCGVYFFTRNDQKEDFEAQFEAHADKVTESFYESFERKLGAISTMSNTITSYASATNATWPYVTIPDMAMRGADTRIQAEVELIFYAPLVTDEQREGWEAYARANRGHLMPEFMQELGYKAVQDAKFGLNPVTPPPAPAPAPAPETEQESGEATEAENEPESEETGNDSRKIRRILQGTPEQQQTQQEATELEQITEEDGFNVRIFAPDEDVVRPLNSGPYLPFWQLSPVLPVINLLNFDLFHHWTVSNALSASYETNSVVIAQAQNLIDPDDVSDGDASLYNDFLTAGQYRHNLDAYQGDPATNLLVPIFDSFGPDRKFAGTLLTSMYFRLGFTDILPDTARGIIVVVENTLNQTFTYQLDGPDVTFLGPGDRHDSKYDDMVVYTDVASRMQSRASPENQGFNVAELNVDFCSYSLRVYPSQATEDQYVTNEPIYYTCVVVAIFLFTSFIFIAYDLLVARRQQIVMNRAVQSAAIVSSLYPKQVRERLFDEGKGTQQHKSQGTNNWKASLARGDIANLTKTLATEPSSAGNSGRPIADLYENCTVLFADLAGFTQWSSTRSPEDVFHLLENVYQSLDKMAIRRHVFKVETVGDCYVAVTGVPEPQKMHAVIMVKFARDCLNKMNQLLPSLTAELGPDTATLSFRIGLHTGPVTGGVIRGQKSRFQLFGDTINTSSRMESSGVPGKIHLSEATANELRAQGHGPWVVAREDKVDVKGKGIMQTYFATTTGGSAKSTSGTSIDSSDYGDDMAASMDMTNVLAAEEVPVQSSRDGNEIYDQTIDI